MQICMENGRENGFATNLSVIARKSRTPMMHFGGLDDGE